jgi:YVTN family beta-propeller protein
MLLANWLSPAMAAQHAVPKLTESAPFAFPGETINFAVKGTPGALVRIVAATQPAEVHLGASGTQFYKSGTETTVANGTISADGTFTAALRIPSTARLGAIYYAQAISRLNGNSLLSSGLVYRVQSTAPTGARKTLSIAVTPDGTRAYVADKLSGYVTIIDATSDTKLADLPITLAVGSTPHRPVRIAVDPEGRHAFVSNVVDSTIPVIDTATGSVSAQIPVPRGSRGVGFDFSNGVRRIYVANETQNAVLVFLEAPLGVFTAQKPIPLQTTAPGPLLVLPSGKLAVGTRTEDAVEILDPTAPAGATTIAVTTLSGAPHELVWSGSQILIPTFIVLGQDRIPGYNRVLQMDPSTFQVTGYLYQNIGSDYRSIAAWPTTSPGRAVIAVNGAATGTTLIADGATHAVLANIELTGGYPDASPSDVAIVNSPSTLQPSKLYVLDLFRETVRPIALGSGPPFTEGAEIPLAWSGQVRVPFSGTLSPADDGEWQFRNVLALGGTATAPNPVACNSCHMDGASDNSTLHFGKDNGPPIQVPAPWGAIQTAPYFWDGQVPTIQKLVTGAMRLHNHTGVHPPPGIAPELITFLASHEPPASIYLNQDGSMTPDQVAGKALFEGPAGCTQCHAAPLFIPPPGSPPTIPGGIGTGLAPANVPSLRGAWATAPYLSEGQAKTLLDVLTLNPNDAHGQATAGLSAAQKNQLVEYLKTL